MAIGEICAYNRLLSTIKKKLKTKQMPRRSKKSDGAIGCLALIIGAIVILAKIFLVLLPFVIIGVIIYSYFKWQSKKLAEYDNNWKSFYHNELKRNLKIAAIAVPVSMEIGYAGYSSYQKQEKGKIEREQAESVRKRIEEEKIRLVLQAKKIVLNIFWTWV